MFQTPSVQITVADPTAAPITPGNIPVVWLPPNLMSIGLGSLLDLGALTPPPGKLNGPFVYQWTVSEEANVPTPFTTTDLKAATIRIDFGDRNSIVYVKLKVTDPVTGAFCTSVVRVRRFNTPAISVVVTSPNTGTSYPGGDWDVPSPNPVITLQTLIDPAVPPSPLGPYTYSWAVVDEALNPPPTILNGTTAAPTFTGVANNAVLKVTLTVVASGIGGGLTNSFQKVFRIRLV